MSRRAQIWRAGATGVLVRARVAPKSANDGVAGVVETPDGPALKVRVRVAAEDGRANRSAEGIVAGWLGLAPTRVHVEQGAKSRVKTLSIQGVPHELETLIAARLAALEEEEQPPWRGRR
jgi:uncharacterized protein